MAAVKALILVLAFTALCSGGTATAAAEGNADEAIIRFRQKDLFPEGMDWDSKHGRFLMGSIGTGSIFSLTDTGKMELFVKDPDYAGKCATVGIKVDAPRNRVVVVVHNYFNRSQTFDAVASYDLDTKERNFLTRLDGVGEADPLANDVAVDREGNLYVTNARHNFIWKVTPDGSQAVVFANSSVFHDEPLRTEDELERVCGLNGILYHPDKYLLVDQSNTGALFKVNLRGDQVNVVQRTGFLVGADGLALREDGALVVVSSTKAWLLQSSDHWRSTDLVGEVPLNRSTFVTYVTVRDGSKLYVLHSHLVDLLESSSRSEFFVQQIKFPKDGDHPIWLLLVLVLMVVLVLAWRFQMAHFFNEYKKKRH